MQSSTLRKLHGSETLLTFDDTDLQAAPADDQAAVNKEHADADDLQWDNIVADNELAAIDLTAL
jgi:hypothetical protein